MNLIQQRLLRLAVNWWRVSQVHERTQSRRVYTQLINLNKHWHLYVHEPIDESDLPKFMKAHEQFTRSRLTLVWLRPSDCIRHHVAIRT